MLKHIESFITSYSNVRILHICRHGIFWTILKSCACKGRNLTQLILLTLWIINDPTFSKEAVEQYIDKRTKSRRIVTYVWGSEKTCWLICEITMDKLWRQSPIEQLPETYGDDFEGQNQLLITVLNVCNQ